MGNSRDNSKGRKRLSLCCWLKSEESETPSSFDDSFFTEMSSILQNISNSEVNSKLRLPNCTTTEISKQKNSEKSSALKELRSSLNEQVGVDVSIFNLLIQNSIN